MKILMIVLAVLLCALQFRLWFGDGSVRDRMHYQTEIEALSTRLEAQVDENRALAAAVADLKDRLGEIEARARSELGMIKKDETFYQFVGQNANRHSDSEGTSADLDKVAQQISR